MAFDLQQVFNVIGNAKAAVNTAINTIKELKDTGLALTQDSEEELEARIAELEALLPALRQEAQDKLRGR